MKGILLASHCSCFATHCGHAEPRSIGLRHTYFNRSHRYQRWEPEPGTRQLWVGPFKAACQAPWHRGGRHSVVTMAGGVAAPSDYYAILGVKQTATAAELKQAFRKKALKLHPDVNKAADAKERFMEAKAAFTALSEPKVRADYDRKRQGDFDWGDFASSVGRGTQPQQRSAPAKPEEPFYGFSDFFRDVEGEVSKRRRKAATKEPGTLLEELAAIGEDILEEFVDFLETELGLAPGEGSRNTAAAAAAAKEESGVASSRTRAEAAAASSRIKQQAEVASQVAQQTRKTVDDEVDDMLAALKKKMGKT